MKIRKPSLPAVGAAYSLTVLGGLAVTPKTAPAWLWTAFQVALLVWLMASAAVAAVLWERYGPNGCKLREAKFEEWRAQFNAARANFDSAVADFRSAVNGEGSQETRIQVLDGGENR